MATQSTFRHPIASRIMPAIRRRLRTVGIVVEPYLVVDEDPENSGVTTDGKQFRYEFVGPEHVDTLIDSNLISSREKAHEHFEDGSRCFVAWDGDRIAAKMWCDFVEFSYDPSRRPLESDEIYLYGAFAHPDYRGLGLAPATRQRCYEALRALGRSRFYSVTDYYNLSARRFKEKLGARDDSLMLYVSLFGWWSRTFTLKRYPRPAAALAA
jgi:GNAT superfamily N-acetyltransferase